MKSVGVATREVVEESGAAEGGQGEGSSSTRRETTGVGGVKGAAIAVGATADIGATVARVRGEG